MARDTRTATVLRKHETRIETSAYCLELSLRIRWPLISDQGVKEEGSRLCGAQLDIVTGDNETFQVERFKHAFLVRV